MTMRALATVGAVVQVLVRGHRRRMELVGHERPPRGAGVPEFMPLAGGRPEQHPGVAAPADVDQVGLGGLAQGVEVERVGSGMPERHEAFEIACPLTGRSQRGRHGAPFERHEMTLALLVQHQRREQDHGRGQHGRARLEFEVANEDEEAL